MTMNEPATKSRIASASAASTSPARRVLVVGIDGLRHDTVCSLPMPHLKSVAEAGFLVPVEVDSATPTMSGPCWATIVTGVNVNKHGVWGNHFGGNRLAAFPDFATRLNKEQGRRTFVATGWAATALAQNGGPIFAAPTRLAYAGAQVKTPEAWDESDHHVTAAAVHALTSDDPEASLVLLGAVDVTAHALGCGMAYREAAVRADDRLG